MEIPYDIPETWSWIRLKDFAYLTSGGQYPEDGSGCLYIKVADMNLPTNENEILTSTRRTNAFPEGNIPTCSIIFPKRGGAISTNKKRMVRSEPICIDSNTMAMTSILPDCFYYLKLWFDGIDLASLQSGTSVPQINNKDLEPLLIPIPPLSEQRMIVSKTRELMSAVEAFI